MCLHLPFLKGCPVLDDRNSISMMVLFCDSFTLMGMLSFFVCLLFFSHSSLDICRDSQVMYRFCEDWKQVHLAIFLIHVMYSWAVTGGFPNPLLLSVLNTKFCNVLPTTCYICKNLYATACYSINICSSLPFMSFLWINGIHSPFQHQTHQYTH